MSDKAMVIGMGNLLLKDEGVGIHVIEALRQSPLPQGYDVEIIDGGTSPDVLNLAEKVDKLVIVDAVKGGDEPGTVYRFTPDDVVAGECLITSVHQLGVLESLQMMALTNTEPASTVIIGVEPKDIDWGMELSSVLQARIPRVIELVLRELEIDKRKEGENDNL